MTDKKVEFILDENNTKIRDRAMYYTSLPLETQIYLHSKKRPSINYVSYMVVETDEKITIHYNTYVLRWGRNGFYVSSVPNSPGCSYRKTGKSSQRYASWNMHRNYSGKEETIMFDMLSERAGRDILKLNDGVLKQILTMGMKGYILSGRIFNVLEAMQYHIRYSMRGYGIKMEMASQLYKFYKEREGVYEGKKILQVSEDPNYLLANFENFDAVTDGFGHRRIFDMSRINKALSINEKINWADSNLNLKELDVRFSKKEKMIEELLYLWEGGPVLTKDASPVIFEKHVEDDDLPF